MFIEQNNTLTIFFFLVIFLQARAKKREFYILS